MCCLKKHQIQAGRARIKLQRRQGSKAAALLRNVKLIICRERTRRRQMLLLHAILGSTSMCRDTAPRMFHQANRGVVIRLQLREAGIRNQSTTDCNISPFTRLQLITAVVVVRSGACQRRPRRFYSLKNAQCTNLLTLQRKSTHRLVFPGKAKKAGIERLASLVEVVWVHAGDGWLRRYFHFRFISPRRPARRYFPPH